MEKEIYLVRHAESIENIGIKCPDGNPNLSPKGHWQKKMCAVFLKKYCGPGTVLLSSPFLRCVCTAEAIAAQVGVGIRLEPALHEYFSESFFNMGSLRLPTLQKIASDHPRIEGKYPDDPWWPEANEVESDVSLRLSLLRNRLLGDEFLAEKIICVGHWASVAALAFALDPGIHLPLVGNASVTRIDFDGRHCHVVLANETSFMSDSEEG